MTRFDTFVVGTLVVLLVLVAGVIGVPALQPASTASAVPGTSGAPSDRPYVEGVIGAASSVSPLTARTQADRDLVALVFSGLVRNGPNGTIVPDLARRWSVDAKGKVWTVELRDDAFWHDGEPVTADDVVFTIRAFQDADYTGPAASSWNEVTVEARSPRLVTFTLETPLGGFLQALTQPIAPAHILGEVPMELLPEHPFVTSPIGSGPFALADLTDTSATLVPAPSGPFDVGDDPAGEAERSARPTDSLATAGATTRPQRPLPYLVGMTFRFYPDAEALAAAYLDGTIDAASGLSPSRAEELGSASDSRLLRYPSATLTAAMLNLRPDHPEFRDPAVRTALLRAIDRDRLVEAAYARSAARADGLIPRSSPMFDAKASPTVEYDRTAARKALKSADWTEKDDGWHLPGAAKPLAIEVLSPEETANPGLFAAAEAVVEDWTKIGLAATHVALPPGTFVTERLATGAYQVAIADVAIGLDPDLYPLLASSQTLTGGSNVMGVQDPALDELLVRARAPGTSEARKQAYAALQKQLAKGRYLLPLAFPDEVVVLRNSVTGPIPRQVAEPSERFWDVLTWRLAADR